MVQNKIYIGFIIILLVLIGCSGHLQDDTRVQQGKFTATLTETGELQAVNSYIIKTPFYGWHHGQVKIVHLIREGTRVERGDVVAILDTSSFIRGINEDEIDLAIAKADYERILVQQASGRKDMQSALQSNLSSLESAIIDTQRVQFEPANKQNLSKLRYKRAKLTYESNLRKYDLLLKIQEQERKIQEEEILQIKLDISKAKENIKRFTVQSPASGMIEYLTNRRTQQKVKIGDEFYPNDEFLGLPDLSRIKVKTKVHESDIYKIRKGLPVQVRLDAYPQKIFSGNITSIAFTCHPESEDSQVKVFDVEVLLNENDIALKPGMTVSCEIQIADLNNVYYVAHEYIGEDKGDYFVLRKKGAGAEKVPVTLGPRNLRYVVIEGAVEKGNPLLVPSEIGDRL